MVGLPGSGKTTLTSKIKEKSDFKSGVIRVFEFDPKSYNHFNINNYKANPQRFFSGSEVSIVADGLFTTVNDVSQVIALFSETIGIKKVILHYFMENREACLWNDANRRDENSIYTITNLALDKFTPKEIKSLSDKFDILIKIERYSVVRKPAGIALAENAGYTTVDNKYLRSEEWSLGGTSGNCWGDDLSYTDGSEPVEFNEFYDLLEEVCPTLSLIDSRKIYKVCVKVETREEHDYYGGCISYSYYVCDLVKLYDELTDLGYSLKI